MSKSFSCFRGFVFSCLLVVGCATVAAAQPQPAQASTPRVATRVDTGQKVAIIPLDGSAMAYGYSVVLVLGDMQAAPGGDGNVPPAARKALTDMKDFLPYKSYRLLDAQWILGSQRAITRLRGPNDQEYELGLTGAMLSGKLRVQFRLQEPFTMAGEVGDKAAREALAARNNETAERMAIVQQLQRQAEATEAEAARLGERLGANHPELKAAKDRAAATKAQLAAARRETEGLVATSMPRSVGSSIIDTSFTMDIGETVVVGTSRVRGGDKALIALLTAVPRGSGTEKKE